MIILGIDPGINVTGYGLVAIETRGVKLVEAGTIEPSSKMMFPDRLMKIHTVLTEVIREYCPHVLVLEKLYAHHRHPTTASIMGHVRGVICLTCAQNHLEFAEHSVKRIRKAISGNGNISKEQTRNMVAHALGVDALKLKLDASDALALALGYIYMEKIKSGSLNAFKDVERS